MAVDTRNKRFSLGLSVLPNPDGAFGALDRLQLLGLYSGIAAIGGVHNVYRGIGGLSEVDWTTAIDTAAPDAETITLTGEGHAASTRYTYAVRPETADGLETPDFSNTCEFETDANGDWLGNRPSGVDWLDAVVEDGGDIKLSWSWHRKLGEAYPNDFGLYYGTTPDLTAGSPDATENFVAEGKYSHTFSLTGGTAYWFAVTSRTSTPVESPLSKIIGPFLADSTAPAQPTIVTATRW